VARSPASGGRTSQEDRGPMPVPAGPKRRTEHSLGRPAQSGTGSGRGDHGLFVTAAVICRHGGAGSPALGGFIGNISPAVTRTAGSAVTCVFPAAEADKRPGKGSPRRRRHEASTCSGIVPQTSHGAPAAGDPAQAAGIAVTAGRRRGPSARPCVRRGRRARTSTAPVQRRQAAWFDGPPPPPPMFGTRPPTARFS